MRNKEKLLFQMVDVSSITSGLDPLEYAQKSGEINHLAEAILQAGGLINPLLLEKTGLMSYKLMLESQGMLYYASLRAKEIDPRKGEMVNAFVVAPEATAAVLTQIAHQEDSVFD